MDWTNIDFNTILFQKNEAFNGGGMYMIDYAINSRLNVSREKFENV